MSNQINSPVTVDTATLYVTPGYVDVIFVDTSADVGNIQMPLKDGDVNIGHELEIIDTGGNASVNNVNLSVGGDGTSLVPVTFNVDGQAIRIKLYADLTWRVISNSSYAPSSVGTISSFSLLSPGVHRHDDNDGNVWDIDTRASASIFVDTVGIGKTDVQEAIEHIIGIIPVNSLVVDNEDGTYTANGVTWTGFNLDSGTTCNHPPFCLESSNTIQFSQSGTMEQVGTGEVKKSKDADNCLEIRNDGLYVACAGVTGNPPVVTYSDTDCIGLSYVSDDLTANIILDPDSDNILQCRDDGAFVDGSLLHNPVQADNTNSINITLTEITDFQEIKADVVLDTTVDNAASISSNGLLVSRSDRRLLINQAAHGFSLPTHGFIPVDGNGTIFIAATTTSESTTKKMFIDEVVDVDNFYIRQDGIINVPSHGLSVHEFYFLDDSGNLSLTKDADINSVMCWVISPTHILLIDNRDELVV